MDVSLNHFIYTSRCLVSIRIQLISNTNAECSFQERSQSVECYFDYTMGKCTKGRSSL